MPGKRIHRARKHVFLQKISNDIWKLNKKVVSLQMSVYVRAIDARRNAPRTLCTVECHRRHRRSLFLEA